LLGELEQAAEEWRFAVHRLRREVELSPPQILPDLAGRVIRLTDSICWSVLERGDVDQIRGCAKAAAALGEFIDTAGLWRD